MPSIAACRSTTAPCTSSPRPHSRAGHDLDRERQATGDRAAYRGDTRPDAPDPARLRRYRPRRHPHAARRRARGDVVGCPGSEPFDDLLAARLDHALHDRPDRPALPVPGRVPAALRRRRGHDDPERLRPSRRSGGPAGVRRSVRSLRRRSNSEATNCCHPSLEGCNALLMGREEIPPSPVTTIRTCHDSRSSWRALPDGRDEPSPGDRRGRRRLFRLLKKSLPPEPRVHPVGDRGVSPKGAIQVPGSWQALGPPLSSRLGSRSANLPTIAGAVCLDFDNQGKSLGLPCVAMGLASGCSASRATAPTTLPASPTTTAFRPINIGGVPLVPISRSQRKACQKAANQTHSPVPCPGLVPVPTPGSTYACGPPGSQTCGPPQIQEADGVFLWNQYDFQVPTGYVGVPPTAPGGLSSTGGPLGHFVIYAGRHLTLSRFGGPVRPVPSYCTAVPGLAVVQLPMPRPCSTSARTFGISLLEKSMSATSYWSGISPASPVR